MLHKLATYGICFILVLTASCGIFDPSSSMGTLNIIVEKSDVNTQLNKTMGVLSTAQCIIKRYDSIKYASTIPKTDDCFHSETTSLQAGGHYSVFLYAKYDLSHNIAVSAHQSDILIVKGKKKKVVLSWAEFMTSLSKPELNDTLSEHSVNFEWSSAAGANKYRLIVDDNNTNRTILKEILTNWGFSYKEAADGNEAFDRLKEAMEDGNQYDLILMDAQMPGMDGFEVCKRIKENPDYSKIHIIMLTSMGQQGRNEKGNDTGDYKDFFHNHQLDNR